MRASFATCGDIGLFVYEKSLIWNKKEWFRSIMEGEII